MLLKRGIEAQSKESGYEIEQQKIIGSFSAKTTAYVYIIGYKRHK